jgi:hypothetical protein
LGPKRRFSLNCTLKVPWLAPYEHICRCFKFQNFTIFMFKCWILLKPALGAWAVICTFQYSPWTDSIRPSLQPFQCSHLGRSLVFLSFYLYFIIEKKPEIYFLTLSKLHAWIYTHQLKRTFDNLFCNSLIKN